MPRAPSAFSRTNITKWQGRPSITVSAAARRFIKIDTLRSALHNHRAFDSLPYAFVSRNGRKIMIATTVDFRQTFLFLVEEWESYCKNHLLRKLDGETAKKF